jgi:hypothetical protein
MWEIAGTLAQSFTLGQGELASVLWFGAGLVVGLAMAVAALAACALECLTQKQAS